VALVVCLFDECTILPQVRTWPSRFKVNFGVSNRSGTINLILLLKSQTLNFKCVFLEMSSQTKHDYHIRSKMDKRLETFCEDCPGICIGLPHDFEK